MKRTPPPGMKNGLMVSSGPSGLSVDLFKNGAVKASAALTSDEVNDALGSLLMGAFLHHARTNGMAVDLSNPQKYVKGVPASKVDLAEGPEQGTRTLKFQVGGSVAEIALSDSQLVDLANRISVALAPSAGTKH